MIILSGSKPYCSQISILPSSYDLNRVGHAPVPVWVPTFLPLYNQVTESSRNEQESLNATENLFRGGLQFTESHTRSLR